MPSPVGISRPLGGKKPLWLDSENIERKERELTGRRIGSCSSTQSNTQPHHCFLGASIRKFGKSQELSRTILPTVENFQESWRYSTRYRLVLLSTSNVVGVTGELNF